MSTLQNHPAADLFPMMSDEELNKLADDIAANGLLEPVVVFQGAVLDGRNRLAACEIADVEPKFTTVTEKEVPSPTAYVWSKNGPRRHMSKDQLAITAAKMVPLLQDEARKRQGRRTDLLDKEELETLAPNGDKVGRVSHIAGNKVGVHRRDVERALKVQREAPEVFEKVERGEVKLRAAVDSLPSKQTKKERGKYSPKDISTGRGKQRAEAHKRRMAEVMGAASGICDGLAKALDVELIRQVCTPEEIETWATMAKSHAREFRRFAARLRGEDGES